MKYNESNNRAGNLTRLGIIIVDNNTNINGGLFDIKFVHISLNGATSDSIRDDKIYYMSYYASNAK